MSKKHVDKYYEQVCNDYHEMIECLRDMEEEASKNLVSPDRLEQMKKLVEPIKDNYMRLSYIMYLLNLPNKKEKKKKYIKQNSKKLSNMKIDTELKEDKELLDKIKYENN